MTLFAPWSASDAASRIAIPHESDDKYSRGVLGVITGSAQFPGAAVLGVEAALHTGVGMLRYLGPERPSSLVLARRPEAVTSPGRVQAWLIGSGMDHARHEDAAAALIREALDQRVPLVLDGGAIGMCREAAAPTVITPHFRELSRLMGSSAEIIAADPASAAAAAAEQLGVTVLLKGHTTYIASPGGTRLWTRAAPTWLATAGAGDALGGILGALVATHSAEIAADGETLARLAATTSVIQGLAAARASRGGPFTILGLTGEIPGVIAGLREGMSRS